LDRVLNQLNLMPGVVGSMICDSYGQVLAKLFPSEIDSESLNNTAIILMNNAPALRKMTGDMNMLDLRYEKIRVVVRFVDDICFVIQCLSNAMVNLKALEISINAALRYLEKTVRPKSVVGDTSFVHTTFSPKISPADLIQRGPLSVSLTGMQTALAKFLGPMAKVIFAECVEKWTESHKPAKDTLPELIKLINHEINDREKSVQFMKMVFEYM
jgi:predicted regulator of Ras-like GTPase activity (Roadblock/LC7/MglB family)